MEIELKYLIDDAAKINDIFSDEYIVGIRDEKKEEMIPMHAVYYDTEDRRLTEEGIALRIRKEGERNIGTLKWHGTSEDGMHKRQEINVPVSDEAMTLAPEISIFDQSEMSEVLEAVVGTRRLLPMMEVDFMRRLIRLDTGKSISEMSADSGEIKANGKTIPILELEIELFSGNEEEIVEIGRRISEKYQLKPGNKSKFERGYELLT